MPNNSGIWDQEEADNNHIFSYRVAQFIGNFLNKETPIIDFGCGKGTYCKYFEDIGFKSVYGIDGILYQGVENNNFFPFDLTQSFKVNVKGNAICLEVGEHISEESLETFINNITNNCNGWLIISWALPGQEGIGHVSCKPNQWVIDEMAKRGFEFMQDTTEVIRQFPEGFVNYFKETLLIFKKL